jgi:hypothetical protein
MVKSTNGKKKNAYRLLGGKPEGKRSLGRPRLRLVDNIRMDLGEVGCYNEICIYKFVHYSHSLRIASSLMISWVCLLSMPWSLSSVQLSV